MRLEKRLFEKNCTNDFGNTLFNSCNLQTARSNLINLSADNEHKSASNGSEN